MTAGTELHYFLWTANGGTLCNGAVTLDEEMIADETFYLCNSWRTPGTSTYTITQYAKTPVPHSQDIAVD